jgi:hypothetical protein
MDSDSFHPSIRVLLGMLETDPKQFPKKDGKLKEARGAPLRFADGVEWRAVFVLRRG